VAESNAAAAPAATVAKALGILNVIAEAREPLEFKEIAATAGVPKPTLHRLLRVLLDFGLVHFEPTDRTYGLGPHLFRLARKAWLDVDLQASAERKLIQLRRLTGEQAHVGMLDGLHVVYLDEPDTPAEIRVYYGNLRRLPAHCTAIGKAILAFMREDDRDELLAGLDLTRYTPATLVERQALEAELLTIRARGYALEDEEHEAGMRGLAAPLLDYQGRPLLAIGITGPAFRLTRERAQDIGPELVEIAKRPARRFGGAPLYTKARRIAPPAPSPARCVLPATAFMGDSPIWCPDRKALLWVDILAPAIQLFDPKSGGRQVAVPPHVVGALALARGGRLLLALQNGFFLFDPASGGYQPLGDPEADRPDNRFNDAKLDRRGRLVAGTMHMARARGMGSLYRLDPDGRVTRLDQGLDLCNGIAWSLDDRRMYLADSVAQRIYLYDWDQETGTPSNRRVFVEIPAARGEPGGLTVDAEDHLWCSFWDGWCVQRFDPDGRVERVIPLPVPRPTSVAFGGPDLATLFVTSARIRMSSQQLLQAPLSGSLFAIETGIRGVPEPVFGQGRAAPDPWLPVKAG
jgi:sugar lactone lactonase YvrE/DNA-binding IclR family transcriptional regulator